MTAYWNKLWQSAEAQRAGRFLIVGGVGTLIDFCALALLKSAGMPTLPANTISFSLGLINNFTLNRAWTFRDAPPASAGAQFLRFAAVSLAGLAISNGIVMGLESAGIPTLAGKIAATGVVVVWNFSANRAWTFRQER